MIKPKNQNWNPSVNCLRKLEIALFKIILKFDGKEKNVIGLYHKYFKFSITSEMYSFRSGKEEKDQICL